MTINFPNTLEKANYLKKIPNYMVIIPLRYILPQKVHVLRKLKSGSLKAARSPSLGSSSFTPPSGRTAHRPGWRWAARGGAGRSCWAPQGGGGRRPGARTRPWSPTWQGRGAPPSGTAPRAAGTPVEMLLPLGPIDGIPQGWLSGSSAP